MKIVMLAMFWANLSFGAIIKSFDAGADPGTVKFTAVGYPSALRIQGQGESPTGHLTLTEEGSIIKAKGELEINLKTLETGIALRDRHMRDKYLEVEKFNKAVLKIADLQFDAKELAPVPFTGVLKLHGIEKPISGKVTFKKVDGKIQSVAEMTIKITDFGISIPSFAGVTVAENVEVQVSLKTPAALVE